jgi:hypothetical protein
MHSRSASSSGKPRLRQWSGIAPERVVLPRRPRRPLQPLDSRRCFTRACWGPAHIALPAHFGSSRSTRYTNGSGAHGKEGVPVRVRKRARRKAPQTGALSSGATSNVRWVWSPLWSVQPDEWWSTRRRRLMAQVGFGHVSQTGCGLLRRGAGPLTTMRGRRLEWARIRAYPDAGSNRPNPSSQ